MLIFDAHLDLAFNAVEWNRDLRLNLHDLRAQERNLKLHEPGRGSATVTFPELQRGEVRLGVATLFARQELAINHPFGYTTAEACYAAAHAHLAYYRAMQYRGWVRLLKTRRDLAEHTEACEMHLNQVSFGFILSMECADAILEPSTVSEWYDLGLRIIGLTHYGTNRYGGGTRSEAGLSVDAVSLLQEMHRIGMAMDLTHLSDRSFDQVIDLFPGRVLASHQNARKFCDWQRQFSDAQIRAVLQRDGVLGVALDAIMLQPNWVRGITVPEVTLERVVDNIDHICQLAGDTRHVGIGSDLDGGYGTEQTPKDLDSIADLQKLVELLQLRNYSDDSIRGILHQNWIRFFQEVLPE